MAFLSDSELKILLQSINSPIKNLDLSGDLDSFSSPIQPCSVDLHISEVFLPFKDETVDIETAQSKRKHSLGVGESVKVKIIEEFDLQNEYGALLVAPAKLTRRGVIISDLGHVDPGFKGKLRLTLINMGRNPYELVSGNTIVTVLLFRLSLPAKVGLRERITDEQPELEGIQHLAADFLYIKDRAEKYARETALETLGESGWKKAFFSWCLPIIIGILAALVTYYIQVDSRLVALETTSKLFTKDQEIDKRLNKLESMTLSPKNVNAIKK